MIEENFHPNVRAFWSPIGAALAGGAVFGLAGWLITGPQGGSVIGAVAAMVFYLDAYYLWRGILARSYQPWESEPVGSDLALPDPDADPWYSVKHEGGMHILYSLPVRVELLELFARGMAKNPPVPTTYDYWLQAFSQDEFAALRDWLCDRHWAVKGKGDRLQLTDQGRQFCVDVVHSGIYPFSPTPPPSPAEI